MESYSDDELIYLLRCGNQQAEECLMKRYYNYVYRWLLPYRNSPMPNYDYADLMQIAMMNLPKIIDNYRDDQKTSLRTFAKLAIKRRLASLALKGKDLRLFRHFGCVTLDDYVGTDERMRYEDIIADPYQKHHPEIMLLIKEEQSEYNTRVLERASPLEIEVVNLINQGYNQDEIAKLLKIPIKSVYNAIYRYHKKIEGIDVGK